MAGDYYFLEGLQVVLHRGREVTLSTRRFDLAIALFRHVGHTVDSRLLWTSLCDETFAPPSSRALQVCVASVRKKLALYPENGFTLRAVYKRGYQLRTVPSRVLAGARANSA